jgi:DNA mismatch repair protein MutL
VPTIQILSDRLASQIAAGEVVERPASVLKELIENSLDAGAREVDVELIQGGRRQVAVRDDGVGMDASDALLAFDRHATSKIRQFEDLERVATLGFRGEALASIASVAKVELITATAAGEGTRVAIEGGRVLAVEPVAARRGTSIDVRSLFWNVPARRKFLKTPETELRRCLEVVQGYALARVDVRFVVRHEGRLVLDLPASRASGAAGLRERVRGVYGDPVADRLAGLPETSEFAGWVGLASAPRGRRPVVLVNGRLVRDRAVSATFYRAVREVWRTDEFPALFLALTLDPAEVDVNVHPQKAEVRFRDGRVLDRLYESFRQGLEAARGVEPARPRVLEGALPGHLAWSDAGQSAATAESPGSSETGPGGVAEPLAPTWPTSPGAGWGGLEGSAGRREAFKLAEATYAPLSSRSPLSGRFGELRSLRVVGQYKGTLILLEGPNGLYLVDQHVAHERIHYERLKRSLAAGAAVPQQLLAPVLLSLSPSEARRLAAMAAALETQGFSLRELSGGTLALSAHPAEVTTREAEDMLLELAGHEGDLDPATAPERLGAALVESQAANAACKAAIKMHHPLGLAAMEGLIEELLRCEHPFTCPHGRPVFLELTDPELERWFGRR